MKNYITLVVLTLFALIACSEDKDTIETIVKTVQLDKEEQELEVGETYKFQVTYSPAEAGQPTYSWATSNDKIISVDDQGEVTALSKGQAFVVLTAITAEGTTLTVTSNFIVYPDLGSISSVKLDVETLTIRVNESYDFTVTYVPEGAPQPEIVWASSDDAIVEVTDEGRITGVAEGVAVITLKATTHKGQVFSATSEITVDEQGATTILDADGNVYDIVTIGEQVWLAENLKTTSYNDGSPINYPGKDKQAFMSAMNGNYSAYDNDLEGKFVVEGALYNWYAVNTGKLAPKGWRVATIEDYNILVEFLGGADVAGGKMKIPGNDFFKGDNDGATNTSGFSAMGAGMRNADDGNFGYRQVWGSFWTASETNETRATRVYVQYNETNFFVDTQGWAANKNAGHAVRLIKE